MAWSSKRDYVAENKARAAKYPDASGFNPDGSPRYSTSRNTIKGTLPLNTGGDKGGAVLEGPSYAAQVDEIRNALGEAPTISYTPMAQEFAAAYAPKPIAGLGGDYFNSQREQMKEQLRQEFFGQTGVAQQQASGESAAGRLGSGVGKRILEETVARPFMEQSSTIDRNILQAQLQETARVQQFNADQFNQFTGIVANMQAADSSNALQAATAQATLSGQYDELAARLNDARLGRASQEEIARLDADTRLFIASQDAYLRSLALEEEKRRGGLQYIQVMGQFKPQSPSELSSAEALAQGYGLASPVAPGGPTQNGLPSAGYPGQVMTDNFGQSYQWGNGTWQKVAGYARGY